MIQIDDLSFSYPRSSFDLRIPQLTISESQATAIVGPSGSGKTTLLHLIAGILKPDSGRVRVADTTVNGESDASRRRFRLSTIGLIFQEFELIEYLSVLDNVLLPCRISDAVQLTKETRQRAEQLLEDTGLKSHMRKSVTKLSQGERQRVAICRALLPKPSLLLADEPTGNLDPETSRQILNLLLQSILDHNTTLVTVTHDHSLLDRFDHTVDFQQFLTPASVDDEQGAES